MTSMLHRFPDQGAFGARLQLAQLEQIVQLAGRRDGALRVLRRLADPLAARGLPDVYIAPTGHLPRRNTVPGMRRLRTAATALAATAVAAGVFAFAATAAAPTALTGPVNAVGGSTATVTGTVNPGGAATDWWFEYGTIDLVRDRRRGRRRPARGRRISPSNASLTRFSPATTYHYRLVAKTPRARRTAPTASSRRLRRPSS